MKTAVAAVSVACLLALLAACEPETRSHRPPPPQPGITGETPTPSPSPFDPNATPTPDPSASPTPDPNLPPTPTPSPSPASTTPDANIPYAQPVPGKPGYVISPYSNQGFVNVEGLAPNSLARCPYTKKIFRVP
jgi:hypothetical protein